MRKLSALALAVCILCFAATATAATIKYRGNVAPSGKLSFEVEREDGKQKVAKVAWTAIPVDCGGQVRATSGSLTYKVRVKKHEFSAKAVLGDPDNPKAKANIHGTLSGKTAAGRISLSGTELPLDQGNSSDCRSGKLSWSASR